MEIEIKAREVGNISRVSYPMTCGVPFPRGFLKKGEPAILTERGNPVPVQQSSVTATWEDGSVKWALFNFAVNVDALKEKKFNVRVSEEAELERGIQVQYEKDVISVDTGKIYFTVPKKKFSILSCLKCGDKTVIPEESVCDLIVKDAENRTFSASKAESFNVEIERAGPARVDIKLSGKHAGDHGTFLDFEVRIYAYYGCAFLELEHTFINCEKGMSVEVKEVKMVFPIEKHEMTWNVTLRGVGWARLNDIIRDIKVKSPAAVYTDGRDNILYQDGKEIMRSGDTEDKAGDWVAGLCDSFGLGISIDRFMENHPKKIALNDGQVELYIYPHDGEPLKVYQGSGKTHRIILSLSPTSDLEEIRSDCVGFHRRVVPVVDGKWVNRTGVLGEIFPDKAEVYPRIESMIHQAFARRRFGTGMMNYGDMVGEGYTRQGRGRGAPVWLNNEYDVPYIAFVQFFRSSDPRFFFYGETAVRHFSDVDCLHCHENPLIDGALIIHSAEHVSAQRADPSHMWTEGAFLHYHLTGSTASFDAGLRVADNLLRRLEEKDCNMLQIGPGGGARIHGWGMIALCGSYASTGDRKYLEGARRIAKTVKRWMEEKGGLVHPISEEKNVVGITVLMTGIAIEGLERLHRITGEEWIADLILKITDWAINVGTIMGIFYYKQNIDFQVPSGDTRMLSGLAFCYRYTGDQKYLRIGMRQVEYRRDYSVEELRETIPFFAAAHEAGILKKIDFQF